jgi:four helix bundle protein
MAKTIERFEDLDVGKSAMKCANLVYDLTSAGSFRTDHVLRDQIRRAAVSIFSSIAEGFERDGNKELVNFLTIAKGSCGEARSQVLFAFQRGYLSEDDFEDINQHLLSTSKQISVFRNYLRNCEMKGRRYS